MRIRLHEILKQSYEGNILTICGLVAQLGAERREQRVFTPQAGGSSPSELTTLVDR